LSAEFVFTAALLRLFNVTISCHLDLRQCGCSAFLSKLQVCRRINTDS